MHRRAAVSGARFLEAAVSLRYKDAGSKIATSAAAPKCAGRSRYPLELSTDGIAVSRSPVPAAGSRTQTREDPAGGSRTSFRAVRSAISGGMLTRPTWSSACASRSYRSFYLLLPPPGCASGMAVPSTERVPVPSGVISAAAGRGAVRSRMLLGSSSLLPRDGTAGNGSKHAASRYSCALRHKPRAENLRGAAGHFRAAARCRESWGPACATIWREHPRH